MLRIPVFDAACDRSLHTHAVGAFAARGVAFARALDDELHSWAGTPHRAGQQRRGQDGGVDCTHFAAAVTEWAYAAAGLAASLREAGPLPRSAQDLGVHRDCVEGIGHAHAGAAWWFARRFPLRVVGSLSMACSLDLVALTVAGGANHLAVVGEVRAVARGPMRADLWHASGGAGGVVCRASLADAAMRRRVRMVFRPCVPAGGG